MIKLSQPIYIDGISCAFTCDESFSPFELEGLHHRSQTLKKIEAQYGNQSPILQSHTKHGTAPVTSLTLSLASLNPFLLNHYQAVVLAQTYPDIEPLACPLQKIIEFSGMKPETVLGITHVQDHGSLLALWCLDTILDDEHKGILLATEFLPYQHQRTSTVGPARANASTCISLQKKPGSILVSDLVYEPLTGAIKPSELGAKLKTMSQQQNIDATFISTRYAGYCSSYRRATDQEWDFQSSDVWLSFVSYLKSGAKVGSRVLLAATDEVHAIIYCFLNILDMPQISITQLGEPSNGR